MAGLHQRHQADKKAQGLLDGRGFDTQRLPGAPLAGKTPQTHPAAQAKTQVTASCEPAQLKSVVLPRQPVRSFRAVLAVLSAFAIPPNVERREVPTVLQRRGNGKCREPPGRRSAAE